MGIDLAALGNAVLASIIFTAIEVIFFGLTIWVLAKVLPFSLRKEIEDDQNIALGVMIGAAMIGIALIIAAAVHG